MACLRSALKVRMVVVDHFDIEQVKGYTIMPNYHQRDRTLSIKAKGILSQMFSLPEGWDYTLRGLAYLNTDGIDSMRSGIRELERTGYMSAGEPAMSTESSVERSTKCTLYHASPHRMHLHWKIQRW